MKKLGYLILAIITALACSLGTAGCGKEKELLITDYFENEVGVTYYTTDENSEYYDAEKEYGLLPIGNDTLPLVPYHGKGLIDNNTMQKKQYYWFMFSPKLNAHEIKVTGIEFDVETDIDCRLSFRIMGMIGLNEAEGYQLKTGIDCVGNRLTNFSCEFGTPISWTEIEAGKGADWEKKKLAIILVNKGNEDLFGSGTSVGDAKYIIKNLKFIMEKA